MKNDDWLWSNSDIEESLLRMDLAELVTLHILKECRVDMLAVLKRDMS